MQKKRSVIGTILLAAVFGILSIFGAYGMLQKTNTACNLEVQVQEASEADVLAQKYMDKLFFGESRRPHGMTAENLLNGGTKSMYHYVAGEIKKIANGEYSTARIQLSTAGLQMLGIKTVYPVSEFSTEVSKEVNVRLMLEALLSDMPYELYWYDKTAGLKTNIVPEYVDNTYSEVIITSYEIYFAVAEEFRGTGYSWYTNLAIDTSKTSAIPAAVDNAKAIVEEHKSLSDYEKILAYKNEIQDLVSYNDAAAGGGVAYGAPWQLVYVFDEISSTNVVCEGYAKAFHYLCQLSVFHSSVVESYVISGTTTTSSGSGGHMWNIVTMDDERNYLVDVTNSDSGAIGEDGGLFLNGASSGSVAGGYTFVVSGQSIRYTYDSDMNELWGGTSVLAISTENYSPTAPEFMGVADASVIYTGTAPTVGHKDDGDFDIEYDFGGTPSQFNFEYSWFLDDMTPLASAPTNAGEYKLELQATSKVSSARISTKTINVEIKQASVEVSPTFTLVHESGKTIADVNFLVNARGVLGESLSGTTTLKDSSNNPVSNSSPVLEGENYTYIFDPDNANYKACTGEVEFWHESYTIEVDSSIADSGTITGSGVFEDGETVTLTAVPADGFVFVCWKENGVQVSTSLTYSFVIHENHEIIAVFEAENTGGSGASGDADSTKEGGIFDTVAEYMWYVLYALAGIAVIAVIAIIANPRKNKED